MDLIQNPVLNREGKKWKQRWAVLKKVTAKSLQSTSDASHAKEGKEKAVLPIDFCGLEVSKQYDKANNVLVIITLSQTVFLSFDQRSILDKWQHLLTEHFGQAVCYDISIPDKQKLKPGEATLRLYQSFFSIVTNKNFRCLNRWYISDVNTHSALDHSHFMFEVFIPMKSKGFVVNLLVPNNADEVARAFDGLIGQATNSSLGTHHNHFHGSAILDELGQAKRNAGDQSFFRRVILRASKMRKRNNKRGRAQTAESGRKKNLMASPTLEEAKYRSLDRRKSPDLSVELNDVSAFKAMQFARSRSEVMNRKESEPETPAPQLPQKKTSSDNIHRVKLNDISSDTKKTPERSLLKPRSMTTNDIPNVENNANDQLNTSKSAEDVSESDGAQKSILKTEKTETTSNSEQKVNVQLSDKSDIVVRQARTSADSYTSSSYPAKHPAKYYIDKTKRPKNVQKTPTPPPRSPVSLGLQPNMFVYPSNEHINEEDQADGSLLHEIDNQLKRNTIHSDVSDDAFIESGAEPSPDIKNNNMPSYNPSEPLYGNVSAVRNSSDSNMLNVNQDVIRRRNFHKNSTKHLSDPLIVDNWAEATGDGGAVSSMVDLPKTDYVNVKGTSMSEDENDSYVNVSGASHPTKKKKHKPTPLRMKNNFMKYDDDDDDVYHALAGTEGTTSNSLDAINQSNGSYENVNAVRRGGGGGGDRKGCEYLNLPMSPSSAPTSRSTSNSSSLNYVMVGGKPDIYPTGYSSGSPVRQQPPRSPADGYNKSNYIMIDGSATSALKRSVDEHQRNSPTKIVK